MANGDELLNAKERIILNGDLESQIEIAITRLRRVQALGGGAYAVSLFSLPQDTKKEIVEALRSLTQDVTIEQSDQLISAFEILSSVIEGLNAATDDEVQPKLLPVLEIPIVQLPSDQATPHQDETQAGQEELREPAAEELDSEEVLNESARKYIEDIVGHIDDWSGIGTKDAQMLTDFLMDARVPRTKFINGFDFENAFLYKFQNKSDDVIAEKLGKSLNAVRSSISGFKGIIAGMHTRDELRKAFEELFTGNPIAQRDEAQAEIEPAVANTQPEYIPIPPHSDKPIGISMSVDVPRPPAEYRPTIAHQVRLAKGSEEIVHADLFTELSRIFKDKPGFQTKTLQLFLNLNLENAGKIDDDVKGNLAHIVNQLLESSYGSIKDALVTLKFEETEIVAFRNVFGWRIENGQEQRGEPTLALIYIRKNDGRNIDEDRRDAVKAVFRKIADGFAEQAAALPKK